ncbi:hypothetical protein EDD18DRAFT_1312696 [Armillaria luteobubalina]|uniref:CxC2-like cysteine cluster KDZ transposase-associated domain-containing protein n=1 Tax=Armillaria luteobubalina TaxID=153913 RepID=A0AA39P5M2_9AGAR|nr:hypothetical protein EDD18DRAFT_1312696 [Armillaria luteobubalina]
MFSARVNDYIAESLRREGHGDAISQTHCSVLGCDDTDCHFCCITCRDGRLFCSVCIVSLHSWNGNYFNKVLLHELGLRYQVGHLTGEVCPHPQPAFGNCFTIIDTNSDEPLGSKRPFALQLQSSWLFPAADTKPRTTITTAALEQFQMLTFMGKISAYKCYHSLVHLTNNTGITAPLDNFDVFIHVVCEWSFIRHLKRAGIGNDCGGWKAAKPGSCAMECLACPHLEVNIPEHVDPNDPNAWEDTLYVGMDANFRLERFNFSSKDKDPGLSKGLAYFVDTEAFHEHLKDFDNSCSNHEAAKGEKRSSIQTRDLAASGVGGVVCTRHELKLPLSFPSYAMLCYIMDFGYLTAIRRFAGVPRIIMSYDIACQWSINLEECVDIYGNFLQPKIPEKVYLVLKFHLPGHIKDCQEKYCVSFHIHVGENDREAPERSWEISNGVAASMREMGPGHRCEKLDQHFGDFNWQKNVSQGDTLLHKIKDAVPKASEHEDQFERFTVSLPQSDVATWSEMVEAWEVDRNKPNPFTQTVASKTEAAMHLQLAQEDAQDEMAGLDGDALHTTSPKGMISQGIQLESSQRRISRLNKELGAHSTDLQRAQVLKKNGQGKGPSFPAYSLPLYLPSSILPAHPCKKAIGYDLLHTICTYKDGDTNCHKTMRDLNTKQLTVLSTELGEWGWQAQLHVLEDSDVRRIANDEVGISEGLRIEWRKTHAQAHRWHEECKLLKVEMDHVKCTLEHEANLWLSCAKSAAEGAALINAGEGAGAYAKRQAAIRTSMRLSFEEKWWFVAQWLELGETGEPLATNEDVFTTD